MGRCQNPACGRVIPEPTYSLSAKARQARKYCTKPCWDQYLRDRATQHYTAEPIAPLEIPESARRVATWDGVPARCWHCGGCWRRIAAGVGCLQCGRDLYVAAAVQSLAGP